MRKRGFTLIELLVVIAIIAILAAILFPVFLTVRASARQAECMSNMGQLGRAVLLYSVDSGGRLPPNCIYLVSLSDQVNIITWDKNIYRFVTNKKVFTCPINKFSYETGHPIPYPPGVIVRSYAMPRNISAMLADRAPRVSATVLLYEKGAAPIFTWTDHNGESFYQTWGLTMGPISAFWHSEGKNFAYCDGHAAFFKAPYGPFSYSFGAFPKGYCGSPEGANLPR